VTPETSEYPQQNQGLE